MIDEEIIYEDDDAEKLEADEKQGSLDRKVTKTRDSGSILTKPKKVKDYGTLD